MTISAKTKVIDERAALLHVLPALALEVVGEALGKLLLRLRPSGSRWPRRRVRPGNGTPDSVAELSCWKLVERVGLHRLGRRVATLDSGTSVPAVVRT